MYAFSETEKLQIRSGFQNKRVGEIIPAKTQRMHSKKNLQCFFGVFIQTVSANNGVEEKDGWVPNGVDDPGGGVNVAGASVHRHHLGGEEGRRADAADEKVRMELLP